MAAFVELGLCPSIIRSVEEMGWGLPTPVQQEAIPLVLGGGDVMAAAETGSGKTGAFALPILQIAHEALQEQQLATAKPKMEKVAAARAAAAAAAGSGVGADRDGLLTVSADGLTCSCSADNAWAGGRAGVGVIGGGVYFFEVTQSSGGLSRVGWSTINAKLALGTDAMGFGFGGTGKKSNGNKFESFGEAFGQGDVITCVLDRSRDKKGGTSSIHYLMNGKPLGAAFEVPVALGKHALYPHICIKACTVKLNLGATPTVASGGSLPAGAVSLARAAQEHVVSNAIASTASSSYGPCAEPQPSDGRAPLALILEPARDLCEQVYECVVEFGKFFTEPRLSAALLVGGVDAGQQLKRLKQGVDVVCGTPGRVADLVHSGKLRLSEVQFFVLDEADRLLDTGNLDTILKLHAALPRQGRTGGRLQTLLFSATLHTPEVRSLAERITVHPILVDLKGKEHVPETVQHVHVPVDPEADLEWADGAGSSAPTDGVHQHDKTGRGVGSAEAWSEGVKRLKPLVLMRVIARLKMTQALIFCRTNLDCDHLEAFLNRAGGGKAYRGKAEKGVENPYSCVVLAGMRSMDERRRNLAAFKEGDVRFMICTDVAARGLDIKELPIVVNMTLPDKEEDYVHRVGRVGRADVMGLAVSLVAAKHKEKVWYYDKKKWEGKTLSTKLASNGGCCIWYDEPALFAGVQKRLGGAAIESLEAFLQKVPGGVASLNSTLGQAKDGGLNAETEERLSALAPQVAQLAELEVEAQRSFVLGVMHQVRWVAAERAKGGARMEVGEEMEASASKRPKDGQAGQASADAAVVAATVEADADVEMADDAAAAAVAAAGDGRGAGGGRGPGKRRHRGRGGGRGAR